MTADFLIAILTLLGAPLPEPMIREFGVRNELLHRDHVGKMTDLVKSRIVPSIGLPRLAESSHFVTPAEAQRATSIGRSHMNWLEDWLELEPWREDVRQWRREAQLLWSFWDALSDGQAFWRDPFERRQALLRARTLLGKEDWMNRVIPPIVPHWRFSYGFCR